MQNQYVGDIGDFGKYGLLRKICGITSKDRKRNLSLGVVWYLVPSERNNDGKKISYLGKPKEFCQCDPELFKELKKLVCKNQRKVSAIQKSGLLPSKTVYHDELLPYDTTITKDVYRYRRGKWLDLAKQKIRKSNVIFCDPDNGFEVKSYKKDSVRKGKYKGSKYVFLDEAEQLYDPKKQTAVFYQHKPREKIDAHIESKVSEIEDKLLGGNRVIPITFENERSFFVIPSEKHHELITARIREMEKEAWADHIQVWRV